MGIEVVEQGDFDDLQERVTDLESTIDDCEREIGDLQDDVENLRESLNKLLGLTDPLKDQQPEKST